MSMSLVDALWLVPLLPALAGVLAALLPLRAKGASFALAQGAIVASAALSLWILYRTATGDGLHETANVAWLAFGAAELQIGVLLNPLTAVMIAAVSFVSSLIFAYSHGYMHDDERYARFFCFLALFCGGMLGLCVANSLVLLFVSWEIVGLASYLLIGFWYMKPSAAAAAKKAFLVTKIGDVGFLLGILWLYKSTGTQLLYDSGAGLLETGKLAALAGAPGVLGLSLAGACALLVFCGAVGKSGQFPLHVWLPDAMEGPTPVSALIHAATMVAAGVFLVARMHPLFAAEQTALDVVAWTGAFTALFAATIAVAQNDIKRILAYSTVSQLGFMMLGLGAVGVVAGMFHLVTHAFFKALLFLGAGSVIHGSHHEQDVMKMGGVRAAMPVTFWTYVVGAAALAGVFPLAGFWSKDEILLGALHAGTARGAVVLLPFAMGMAAAFLTAFYMTRQIALVFFGDARGAHHAHESPRVMLVPLVVLAVFAALLGFVGTPWANGFHHLLEPSAHAAPASIVFMIVASLVSFAGIGAGWMMYGRRPLRAGDADPLARFQPLHRWLENRWYVDELYAATFVRATLLLAALSALLDRAIDAVVRTIAAVAQLASRASDVVDERLVKGGAFAVGAGVKKGGGGFSRLQGGRVQTYLSVVAVGAVVLVVVVFLAGLSR
jgi:NADH-quinone oxidoreductase subunit L